MDFKSEEKGREIEDLNKAIAIMEQKNKSQIKPDWMVTLKTN